MSNKTKRGAYRIFYVPMPDGKVNAEGKETFVPMPLGTEVTLIAESDNESLYIITDLSLTKCTHIIESKQTGMSNVVLNNQDAYTIYARMPKKKFPLNIVYPTVKVIQLTDKLFVTPEDLAKQAEEQEAANTDQSTEVKPEDAKQESDVVEGEVLPK